MAEKLCPLNNMEPCIGKKCAMYLDVTINPQSSLKDGQTLSITTSAKKIFNPPCALTISAYSSFHAHALQLLDLELRNR